MTDAAADLNPNKFTVTRNTTSSRGIDHTDCRYFVLDPLHDQHARAALAAYATAAAADEPQLSVELMAWLGQIVGTLARNAGADTGTETQALYRERLRDLSQISDGWLDGSGRPPTPRALVAADSYLLGLPDTHPHAAIFPRPDGGLQLEWESAATDSGIDEMIVAPTGALLTSEQIFRTLDCPVCQIGPYRDTKNMVCQSCGWDYMNGEPW